MKSRGDRVPDVRRIGLPMVRNVDRTPAGRTRAARGVRFGEETLSMLAGFGHNA